MNCPYCESEETTKNGTREGVQQYRCKSCLEYFDAKTPAGGTHRSKRNGTVTQIVPKKPGISATELRAKFDVDYIIAQTLKKLERDRFYLKDEVRQMTGLRAGYPGLTAALEAVTDYYGRADSKSYYGHPDSIKEMKNQAILT